MAGGAALSRRQASWYEDLVEVAVHAMEYVPGRTLVVPDAASRRPDYVQTSARDGLNAAGGGGDIGAEGESCGRGGPHYFTSSPLDAEFSSSDEDDEEYPATDEPACGGPNAHASAVAIRGATAAGDSSNAATSSGSSGAPAADGNRQQRSSSSQPAAAAEQRQPATAAAEQRQGKPKSSYS
ncbi:hypothetical protein CYMTET_13914 [Cymbomonas tetramitiformis]|uniref:Uncharacterized protein n=1 Tax=Cymbomonas tetramitiformis TaxID=36881 RepID=A0AAE0GHE6_9CHLO|nr:hypothetical protein CYMTET_13914 [Cymbomonas tetramitiformis]